MTPHDGETRYCFAAFVLTLNATQRHVLSLTTTICPLGLLLSVISSALSTTALRGRTRAIAFVALRDDAAPPAPPSSTAPLTRSLSDDGAMVTALLLGLDGRQLGAALLLPLLCLVVSSFSEAEELFPDVRVCGLILGAYDADELLDCEVYSLRFEPPPSADMLRGLLLMRF